MNANPTGFTLPDRLDVGSWNGCQWMRCGHWPLGHVIAVCCRCCYGWWFPIFFMSTPTREMIQFDEHIFSDGLKRSTTNQAVFVVRWEMMGFSFFHGDWNEKKRKKPKQVMVGYLADAPAGVLDPSKSWFAGNVLFFSHLIWVFPKIMLPPNHPFQYGWFIVEDPIEMDDFGGTPIFGNTHMGRQLWWKMVKRFFPNSSWWEKALLNYERWN